MTGGARVGVDIGRIFTDIVLALSDGTVRVGTNLARGLRRIAIEAPLLAPEPAAQGLVAS